MQSTGKHLRGTARRHCPIVVQHITDYYIKLHFKPYYGVAGSFLNPLIASQSNLGNMERRHQEWFDDNAADIRSPIHDKNAAHDAASRNPTSRTLHERFSSIRATVQRMLRQVKNNCWARKASQILRYAIINDAKISYEAQKGVCGPSRFYLHPV